MIELIIGILIGIISMSIGELVCFSIIYLVKDTSNQNDCKKQNYKNGGYFPRGPETSDGIRTPNTGSNIIPPKT